MGTAELRSGYRPPGAGDGCDPSGLISWLFRAGQRGLYSLAAFAIIASTLALGSSPARAVICGVAGATAGGSVASVPSGTVIAVNAFPPSAVYAIPITGGAPAGSPTYLGAPGAFASQPIVNGAGNDAGAADSLACGDGAVANAAAATAIGARSEATGGASTALGIDARASAVNSIAIGSSVVNANSYNGIAIGQSAGVLPASNNAIALGVAARSNGDNAVAIGTVNTVNGRSSVALGSFNSLNGINFVGTPGWGDNVTVLGFNNQAARTANASGSAIVGNSNVVNAQNAIAIGNNTFVTGDTSVTIGFGAESSGLSAIAIGNGATSAASSAVVGAGATDNSFANAAVYGAGAQVGAAGNVAIGSGANAAGANSVAIGQGSVASAANTVSVGAAGSERRVTNVAAGVSQTDAVNVSQLSSVAAGVQTQITGLQTQITGIQTQINGLQSQISQANSGIAMAMAMGGGFLPDNKRFALATNYGTFAGQSAVAMTALARISDNVVLSGSASYGMRAEGGQFGGRVGVQVAW